MKIVHTRRWSAIQRFDVTCYFLISVQCCQSVYHCQSPYLNTMYFPWAIYIPPKDVGQKDVRAESWAHLSPDISFMNLKMFAGAARSKHPALLAIVPGLDRIPANIAYDLLFQAFPFAQLSINTTTQWIAVVPTRSILSAPWVLVFKRYLRKLLSKVDW